MGLKQGGIVYFGIFSKEDPQYVLLKETSEEVEEDTFWLEERNSYKSYYDKQEILDLFEDEFDMICCKESYSLDFGHSEEHYHGDFEIMMRKR